MLFLATGGTFDKDYNPITGQIGFAQSQLSALLHQANVGFDYEQKIVMQKDSLDMTDEDRASLLQCCHDYDRYRIVIIHGTDTMTDTAKYLAQRAKRHQTIVLTGAMRPAAFGQSDACFNLGFAIASAWHQEGGVYVAMNGLCYPANGVQKNHELGVFERV
jgi:L-asparaginase